MGQMIWYAVDEAEKAGYGKSLQYSKLCSVILDVIHEIDIEDVLKGIRKRERQKKVAVRLFTQSYEQKGVPERRVEYRANCLHNRAFAVPDQGVCGYDQ